MSDSQLILDIWDVVRDYTPVAKRAECALGIMRAFYDYGFESREIIDIVDEDDDLHQAFYEVYHDGEHPDVDDVEEL